MDAVCLLYVCVYVCVCRKKPRVIADSTQNTHVYVMSERFVAELDCQREYTLTKTAECRARLGILSRREILRPMCRRFLLVGDVKVLEIFVSRVIDTLKDFARMKGSRQIMKLSALA